MKKYLVLLGLLLFCASITVDAQTVNVTFQVDMSVQKAKGNFDPATDVVTVPGGFNNWLNEPPANTDKVMDDPDNDLIYTKTIAVTPNTAYEYKYNIGLGWNGKDENTGNRRDSIGSADTTLAVVFFNNESSVPAGPVNVTFQVDMSVQKAKGKFDPAADVVTVPGGFNNWLNEPPANTDKVMDDADNDLVYTKTISMDPGNYEYKYNIGLGWDGRDELGGKPNRKITVGNSDTTLAVDFFNNELPPSGNPVPVIFNVDMRFLVRNSQLDPTADQVLVAGNFNGWGTAATPMDDADGDTVYTVQIDTIKSGSQLFFKFIYNKGGAITWESDDVGQNGTTNRFFFVEDSNNVITAFWDNKDPDLQTKDGNILFQVDMSVMNEIGIYDNVNDSLQVRGGFNGWSDSDAPRSVMNQDFLDPNLWTLDVSFTGEAVQAKELYKYFVKVNDPNSLWTDGWERPVPTGGGNRQVLFEGTTNQVIPVEFYDGISPDWVITGGKNIQVTFNVDMNPAMDPVQQAIPFNPALDTLYWISEQPSFVFSQGWLDKDEMRVLMLTDPDNDNIYSGTLTVQEPAFNSFVYRYGWVSGTDGSWVFEPAGFSNFAYRVRFVGQDAARSFPFPNWNMPKDTWTNKEIKTDQEKDPFTSLTTVSDKGIIAKDFSLLQNYPNPFNPSTTIRFSIPQQSVVTLKIYNILGEEVSTLLNKELASGTYDVTFDAKSLSSGIYFYKIQAGNFVSTKKMMLLK